MSLYSGLCKDYSQSVKKTVTAVTLIDFVFLLCFLYFIYLMVSGSNGFLTYLKFNRNYSNLEAEYKKLHDEKKLLTLKNNGLHLASLDFDILEEESKKLGYSDKNELVFLIKDE